MTANNLKPERQVQSESIATANDPGTDHNKFMAQTILRPTVQAATTLREYGKGFGDIELSALVDGLSEQAALANDGDLQRGQAMLAVQAHTLDAIFNNLARRAINAEHVDTLDRYLKLALRAQSQCRATWEALATVSSGPAAGCVGQANIAYGNLQVNNAAPAQQEFTSLEERDAPNTLLEVEHGERLDPGAPLATGKTDPALETMEPRDRAKDGSR